MTRAISRSTHIKSCLAKHFGGRKRAPEYLRSGMQRDHMMSVLFPGICGPWVPAFRCCVGKTFVVLAEHMGKLQALGEAHMKTSVILHLAQHFARAQEKPG